MSNRYLSTIANDAKSRDDLKSWRWALRGNYWYEQILATDKHAAGGGLKVGRRRTQALLSKLRHGASMVARDRDEEQELDSLASVAGALIKKAQSAVPAVHHERDPGIHLFRGHASMHYHGEAPDKREQAPEEGAERAGLSR